jgi:hypothetical protein
MSAQEINIACREITPAEKKSETGGGGGFSMAERCKNLSKVGDGIRPGTGKKSTTRVTEKSAP